MNASKRRATLFKILLCDFAQFANKELFLNAREYYQSELKNIFSLDRKYFLQFNKISQQRQQASTEFQKSRLKQQREEERRLQYRKNKPHLQPEYLRSHMVFHELRPGPFTKFNQKTMSSRAHITEPFAMMATPMTQWMWAKLALALGYKDLKRINPSHFSVAPNGLNLSVDGSEVQMQRDHPVENLSWDTAQLLIEGLNRLSNSDQISVQNFLLELIPDHQKGDIYDFPTDDQWSFVMQDRGQANQNYFDRDDMSEVPNYGWFLENSDNKTHAVASLRPRMIDIQGDGVRAPFYDLEGNVEEWTKSSNSPPGFAQTRIVRGHSWDKIMRNVRSPHFGRALIDYRYAYVGLRLVRYRR
jgi:formylglycine-generating enzyme required for sulfatase activity